MARCSPATRTTRRRAAIPAWSRRSSRSCARENGVEAAASQVIVTPGGKWAIFLALGAMLNPGDEVLVLEPAWVSYRPMIQLNGGVPVGVRLASPDYRIMKAALRAAVTPRTKALIVNSPNNPTGRVLDADEVSAIAAVAREADLYVISDEIYEHIVFDGRENPCLLADPRLADRTLAGQRVLEGLRDDRLAAGLARGAARRSPWRCDCNRRR